jgi:putative ABC transport system permease protein
MSQWLALAVRNVRGNARRSVLLGTTIAVGTVALVLFINYIAASLWGMRESTIRGGLGHFQIATLKYFDGYAEQQLQYGLGLDDLAQLQEQLSQEKAVRRILPRLLFSGLVSNGPRTLNFQGFGVDPLGEKIAFGPYRTFTSGEPLNSSDKTRFQVVLGQELARRLSVKPGDSVTVMSTTVNGSINAIDLEVTGTVSTGIPETDLYLLQVPLSTVQELLRTKKISYLSVLLNDTELTPEIATRVQQQLRDRYQVKTWEDLAPLYKQVLSLLMSQFIVFGVIIAIVVFLGVATMTLTTIYERAREIGTMRSMGISSSTIRRLFVWEGMMQGVAGALVGGTIAWVATIAINAAHFVMPPPPGRNVGVLLNLLWIHTNVWPIIIIFPVIAMIASWYISRRIGHMQIIEAILSL